VPKCGGFNKRSFVTKTDRRSIGGYEEKASRSNQAGAAGANYLAKTQTRWRERNQPS
jgi:hypothetical protein